MFTLAGVVFLLSADGVSQFESNNEHKDRIQACP